MAGGVNLPRTQNRPLSASLYRYENLLRGYPVEEEGAERPPSMNRVGSGAPDRMQLTAYEYSFASPLGSVRS